MNPEDVEIASVNEERRAQLAFEEGERQGRIYGAAAERARIVAWLRARAESALTALVEEEAELVWGYFRAAAEMLESGKPPEIP